MSRVFCDAARAAANHSGQAQPDWAVSTPSSLVRSRLAPTPPFGAPDIGQRPIKEVFEVPTFGDHSVNGGYGRQPIKTPPPKEPAK